MFCPGYCTVNVSVSVRTTLPLLAITVMGNVPTEVLPLVLTVKVVDPDVMMDCAPRLEVAPIWVTPSTLKWTVPVKAPTGNIWMV